MTRLNGVPGAKALAEIHRLAQLNYIRYTGHADGRMRKRGARQDDVRNALLTATAATWQDEQGNWRLTGGVDLDGDELTACVDLMADVVVVTIF